MNNPETLAKWAQKTQDEDKNKRQHNAENYIN